MKNAYIVSLSVTLALMGAVYLAAPATWLGTLGVQISDPSVMNMIRSVGGFYLGFAVFLLLAARKEGGTDLALVAAPLAMAGLILGRATAILADGMPDRSVLAAGVVELAFAIWGVTLNARKSWHV